MNNHWYINAAVCSPIVYLGDPQKNCDNIINIIKNLNDSTRIVVFPELSISGASLEDLFIHESVLNNSLSALKQIIDSSKNYHKLIFVGLPLMYKNQLLNVTATIFKGEIIAFIPKKYRDKSDSRYFSTICEDSSVYLFDREIPIVCNPLFLCNGINISVSIGNYLNDSVNADILVNPCAYPSTVDSLNKEDLKYLSYTNNMAVLRANTGYGESTSYAVYDGKCKVYELGELIAENNGFCDKNNIVYCDIDVSAIKYRKLKNISTPKNYTEIIIHGFNPLDQDNVDINREYQKLPFIPESYKKEKYFEEIFNIISGGLITRLRSINTDKVVLGFSGGLDSTSALLLLYATFKKYSIDSKNIFSISMPGFGTSDNSKTNASALINELNISTKVIDISKSVLQHFSDIDHDVNNSDTTYENSQARERTQILMDIANKIGGIVIGTGDLSESALGFCTYNGDHMSMYNINASLSKTLLREFALYLADKVSKTAYTVVEKIVNAPVSPELLPLQDGKLEQKTEDILGSYELHDFFLYHMLYNGASKEKLLFLANKTFSDEYSLEYIEKTLDTFIRKFFSQQFKRNCSPDSPAVFDIGLSPHKSFKMPSDIMPIF